MLTAVFWDTTPYELIINRRLGRACRLHLQVEEITREWRSARRKVADTTVQRH
jgi:hypothetical protein